MKAKIIVIGLVVVFCFSLTGCLGPGMMNKLLKGVDDAKDSIEDVAKDSVEDVAARIGDLIDEELPGMDNQVSDYEWKQAYSNFIKNNFNKDDSYYTYGLIYLDDNDVPELFIDTGVEAGGQEVATYYKGQVVSCPLSRIGTMYIERSGLLYTNTGHMDYYPLSITELKDGNFTLIGEGLAYVTEENLMKFFEGGEYILSYEWEGVSVSEQTFNDNVAKLFDLDKAIYPTTNYSYSEMLEKLQ